MPVEVTTLGGTPNQVTLQAWVDAGNPFPMFSHATLQVESNGTDSNGEFIGNKLFYPGVRRRIRVCRPRSRFFLSIQHHLLLFRVVAEWGAQASATMGERFIVPIGSSLVSIGIINPDLVDANGEASFTMERK